jgi:DNA-binding transcriptional LysR family regulator
LLAENHLNPELVLQGAQLVTIAAMVAAGLGVTVVPEMMVHTEFVKGCVAVPFAKPVPMRELVLLRNPLRFESKAAAAFREEAAGSFLKVEMMWERGLRAAIWAPRAPSHVGVYLPKPIV